MKRKPEMESGLDPEKSPGLASPAALEEAGPLPSTPAGRMHQAMAMANAIAYVNVLADLCSRGGSVGLSELRELVGILRGE